MKIIEKNLLSLPLAAHFNHAERETVISLSLGIKSENELVGKDLWEAKKEFIYQLKHILDQLTEE